MPLKNKGIDKQNGSLRKKETNKQRSLRKDERNKQTKAFKKETKNKGL